MALGLPGSECADIANAALLHDIGKIVVPLEIISKPTSLTNEEFQIVKTHCVIGETVLSGTGDPLLALAAEIALHHHEKFNGTGYPNGFRGEDIPLPGRIVGICDVYDALRRDRPYRPGSAHDETISIITIGDGRTSPGDFDYRILKVFLHNSARIENMYKNVGLKLGQLE